MNHLTATELAVVTNESAGCCGAGGCSTSGSTPLDRNTATPNEKENQMSEQTTQTFAVTGMTCGHCASAVTEEIKELPGVTDVDVDLVAGGTSTLRVTGTEPLDERLVASALEEAGDYQLA